MPEQQRHDSASLRKRSCPKMREEPHAGSDAGLAAVVPSRHRSRRARIWRAAGDIALDRRADARDQLRRNPRPEPAGRAAAQTRRGEHGDRVATLAWNTWRHLESLVRHLGIGAIYHTVNPRLFPEQIVWIVNHAEDRVMLHRPHFRAAAGKDRRPAAKHRTLHRADRRARICRRPRCATRVAYEDWLAEADGDFAWRSSTKIPPPACATPRARPAIRKAWSTRHRSNVLHAMVALRRT